MKSSVQARLDRQSQAALARLVRRLGWSPSKVVREGVRLLAACDAGETGNRIIGLAQFSTAVRDLGSNKKHLKGFGK